MVVDDQSAASHRGEAAPCEVQASIAWLCRLRSRSYRRRHVTLIEVDVYPRRVVFTYEQLAGRQIAAFDATANVLEHALEHRQDARRELIDEELAARLER